MAATVFLSESNGAGETVTDNISNLNMGSADQVNLTPANRPLVIPSSGTIWAYVKYFRIKLDSLGGSNQITNLMFWKSSGAYVTGEGITCNCDNTGNAVDGAGAPRWHLGTYATPVTTQGPAWIRQLNVGLARPSSANVSITANGTPNDTNTDAVSGTLSAPGYSQYIALQMLITSATPAGPVNQKTFKYQWDES